jgi:hypothetical protein
MYTININHQHDIGFAIWAIPDFFFETLVSNRTGLGGFVTAHKKEYV